MSAIRSFALALVSLSVAACATTQPTSAPTPSGVPAAPATLLSTPFGDALGTPPAESSRAPIPTTTPSPSPDSSHSNEANGLEVNWVEEQGSGIDPAAGFNDIAGRNGSLVAIGDPGDSGGAQIWTSRDGRAWTNADFPDSSVGLVQLVAVAGGQPGFIVVGNDYEASTGVVYLSADGVAWERIDSDLLADHSLTFAAATDSTFVAFSDDGAAFVSSDGRSWQPAGDASATAVGAGLLALVSDASSFWAVGSDRSATNGSSGPLTVWKSDDGARWSNAGVVAGSEGFGQAFVAKGTLGFELVVDIYGANTDTWRGFHSADGSAWQAATLSPSAVTDLLATDIGFVAVGHYNPGSSCAANPSLDFGVTWTSVDGTIWREMPETGWQGREVQVVALLGPTLVGVGMDWTGNAGGAGRAWTANLPATAADSGSVPRAASPQPVPSSGC